MRHLNDMQKLTRAAFLGMIAFVIIIGAFWGITVIKAHRNQTAAQPTVNAANQALGGFPMSGDFAPDFTLMNQFGQSVTFSTLRGHEVVLAFIDSRCKDVCPLTAQIMYDAKARLKASAS